MCVKCGRSVMGEKSRCVALDQLFHVDCFRCTSCSEFISSSFSTYHNNNNNNNNANICIAQLKQNSSSALMAQTNTVSVFVQMTSVTVSGVADWPEDRSKLLLQHLLADKPVVT